MYSVISVNDKRLPGNTEKWTIIRSWLIRVRLVHSEHSWAGGVAREIYRNLEIEWRKKIFIKKDKDSNPMLGTRGGILLATRKSTFAISEKIHHHTDSYQTATLTLSAGEFLPIIHITGVYLSPDNKVPTSEIKDLYTTLNNNFHVPSPRSPQNPHCHHYHLLTGDFDSWVGTEQEQHLANHLGYPHIPNRVGDPHPRRQPQARVPNSASTTTHARARGRLLLDFLNHHTLIIANDRFLPSLNDSTYEN